MYNVEKNAYINGDALIFSMEGGKQYLQERHYGWTTTGFYVKIWYTYRGSIIRIIGGRKLK